VCSSSSRRWVITGRHTRDVIDTCATVHGANQSQRRERRKLTHSRLKRQRKTPDTGRYILSFCGDKIWWIQQGFPAILLTNSYKVTDKQATKINTSSAVAGARYKGCQENTNSSAVAKRPRDASCLSVVSFNSTKGRVECFIVSHVGYRFVTACS